MKVPEIMKANNTREQRSLFSKNQEYVVVCHDLNHEGYGVSRIGNFVVVTPGLLMDEVAIVKLMKITKRFGYAQLVDVIEPNEHRIKPACSVYDQCGGCDIMHADPELQSTLKENIVKQQFFYHKLKGISVLPIKTMDNPWHYRNKVSCPIQVGSSNTQVGFYAVSSHDIVEFDACLVSTKQQNEIVHFMRSFLKKHPIPSLKHIIIRQSEFNHSIMVGLVSERTELDHQQALVSGLCTMFPDIASVILNINPNKNTILGKEDVVLYGESTLLDQCLGYSFKISLQSFYQVNSTMMEVLYEQALSLAKIQKEDVVLDCYCGIGTISLAASRYAKHVYGVEVHQKAVEDAQTNAKLNQVKNVSFLLMDAKDALTYFAKNNITIDGLIVDPPRAGLAATLIEALLTSNIKKLVYISCNPATLARDCLALSKAYQVDVVQPVDMFLQTKHVETVVLMSRVDK